MVLSQYQRRLSSSRVRLLLPLVVALCLPLTAFPATEDSPASARPQYVAPTTVKTWLDNGQAVTFLDVRERDEFVAGHLPGAINIRYTDVGILASSLPHDQPIVLYCIHSTHRAPQAAKALQALGFANASVLEGGIVAWQADGLTLRASDLAQLPTILPLTERCAELGAKASELQ